MQHLLGVVVIVAFLGGMVLMARRMRDGWSPRRNQRLQRVVFYCVLAMLVISGVWQVSTGRIQWVFLAAWSVFLVLQAYVAFRKPPPDDLLMNYVQDTRHCGQCSYDLTGNTSGVCPECGWSLPTSPVVLESPAWFHWWNGWDIAYLKNWRRTLLDTALIAVLFLGVTVGLAIWTPGPLVGLPALMVLHFAINAVRVAVYGRRHERA